MTPTEWSAGPLGPWRPLGRQPRTTITPTGRRTANRRLRQPQQQQQQHQRRRRRHTTRRRRKATTTTHRRRRTRNRPTRNRTRDLRVPRPGRYRSRSNLGLYRTTSTRLSRCRWTICSNNCSGGWGWLPAQVDFRLKRNKFDSNSRFGWFKWYFRACSVSSRRCWFFGSFPFCPRWVGWIRVVESHGGFLRGSYSNLTSMTSYVGVDYDEAWRDCDVAATKYTQLLL